MSNKDSQRAGHAHHAKKSGFRKDWRLWTVVLLMLAGMLVYVLTDDESIVPGEAPQEPVPIEAGGE